jgi:tetratricopeptide (TPR) repeat protein
VLPFIEVAEPRSRKRAGRSAASVPGAGGFDSGLRFAALVLIVMAGIAAYANSFSGILVFDDEPAIAANAHLRAWPSLDALKAPPDTTLSGRPLASLSFALDAARSGGTLGAYHATNLLIHLGASLLLFGVVRRTLLSPALASRFSSRATTLAAIIATIFVVHPLQTGSVTYIVQRVESLMGLCFLATLYAAIRALDAPISTRRFWVSASILACALGMGAKEVMVAAPLVVLLWDRHFAPGRTSERRPLYAGLFATWIILGVLVAGGHRTGSAGFNFAAWPWWRYLLTQCEVVTHYLRLSLWPEPLVLDYEWPPFASVSQILIPALLLGALLIATIVGIARRTPAAFAGAWFFLILAPTSSVLPIVTEIAAEHRMYLPLAAVIALVVLGLFELGRAAGGRALAPLGWLAAIGVVLLLGIMTRARNVDYQDFDRIWSDTVAKRPHNTRARNNYATSLLAQGRFAEAEPHLRVAVQRVPPYPEAEANLGAALSALGRLEEGGRHLEIAVRLRPDFAAAHQNLGENYAQRHLMGEAAAAYGAALAHKPDDVHLLNRAAWILATAADDRARDGARAVSLAERAVTLTRRQDPGSLDTLAAALAEVGRFEEALDAAREAQALAARASDPGLSAELAQRMARYEKGLPFRSP